MSKYKNLPPVCVLLNLSNFVLILWCDDNIVSIDRKSSYYCIYCQRVEDKEKSCHFTTASLCQGTASLCNCYVTFKKAICKYFIKKMYTFVFASSVIYVYKQNYPSWRRAIPENIDSSSRTSKLISMQVSCATFS